MDVIWLVDEYLGNGKARHAAFSSKRRAIEVAGKSCDHSSKVILVEWTYCHPLSVQQLFPVRTVLLCMKVPRFTRFPRDGVTS